VAGVLITASGCLVVNGRLRWPETPEAAPAPLEALLFAPEAPAPTRLRPGDVAPFDGVLLDAEDFAVYQAAVDAYPVALQLLDVCTAGREGDRTWADGQAVKLQERGRDLCAVCAGLGGAVGGVVGGAVGTAAGKLP